MAKCRVFISHSSKIQEQRDLLETIVTSLQSRDGGYEVLVDRQGIKAGDEWRQKIHAWLADCHAAVILFSKEALESPWVLKEATVLGWRKSQEPEFKLVLVRMPDVSKHDLDSQNYAPLNLNELQHATTSNAGEIVGIVKTSIGSPQITKTPMEKLREEIAGFLKRVDESMLKQACDTHFGQIPWVPGTDSKARFADHLSRKIFQEGPNNLATAKTVLASLHLSLDEETALRIFKILGPFWVEPDAAGKIHAARTGTVDYRDIAMNGKHLYDFTAEMYLARAYPLSTLWRLIRVSDSAADDDLQHISRSVLNEVAKMAPGLEHDPDLLKQYLDSRPDPVFILLPKIPDAELLKTLRGKYPKVTFIFWTAASLPPPSHIPANTLALKPELVVQDEQTAFFGWLDATNFAKSLNVR